MVGRPTSAGNRGASGGGGAGSRDLRPGYVEHAVAELLAGTDPERVVPHVPFRACPGCGARLADPASFVQEFWVGRETRYLVWCRDCGFTGTIVPVERFEGTEATD